MPSTKIAVVGPAGAGKTTLVQRLMGQSPTGTTPTIGFNVRKFNYRGVELLVTDLGGQQAFVNEFWEKMLSTADGIIFVMDAAAPNLFATAYDLFLFVLPRMNNVPMVVLANKQDLPEAASVKELSKLFDFKAASRRYGITALEIFPISALTGQGVKQAIDWLTNQIVLATGGELPTVNTVYVYQIETGIPIAIAKDIFVEDGSASDDLVDLNKEPGLITAFYSALSAFANEIIHANVQSLHLRNPDPTKTDYILFNCVDSHDGHVGCLIVAKNDGNETLLEILAERIIDEVRLRGATLQDEERGQFLVDITGVVRKIAQDFVKTKQIMNEEEQESMEWARILRRRFKNVPLKDVPAVGGQFPATTGSVSPSESNVIQEPSFTVSSVEEEPQVVEKKLSVVVEKDEKITPELDKKETTMISSFQEAREPEITPSQSRIDTPVHVHHDDYEDDEYYRYFRRLSVAERVKEIERRRRQRMRR